MLDYPVWASALAVAAVVVGLIGGAVVLAPKDRRSRVTLGTWLVVAALLMGSIAGTRVHMADAAEDAEIYERVYPLSEQRGGRR